MSIIRYLINLLPISKNKVVFYSFTESFADQPKYIAQQLQRCNVPCKLVWVSEHKRAKTPEGILSVCGRYLSRFHLATAHVIVANNRLNFYWPKGYVKKPGQVYIQTWHGSYGIKKMEADVHTPSAAYINKAKLDSRQIDYLISNSKWLTDILRACFFYAGKIMELGSPRNDLLLSPGDMPERVRQAMGIAHDSKIALFAPTFRDGHESENPPMPDFAQLRDALCKRFGGEWVILARVHPGRRKNPQPLNIADQCVRDASDWPDVTELLAAADAMITDYSSCIFDFLLTGKPAFVYAPDMAEYERTRGLYYPYSETPIPVAEDNSALIYNVVNFDQEAYQAKVADFLREKGSYDRGDAALEVANLVQHSLVAAVPSLRKLRCKITENFFKKICEKIFSIKGKNAEFYECTILGFSFSRLRKIPKPPPNPYKHLPIQNNKIVLKSVHHGYRSNCKYIAEEILRRKLPYELVWCCRKPYGLKFLDSFPPGIKLIMEGTDEADREMSTAKIWIDENLRTFWVKRGIRKRPGQYFIQTWHGSFGLKEISFLRQHPISQKWLMMGNGDTDYLTSNSKWETELAFKPFHCHQKKKGKIIEIGHTRNDILFHPRKDEIGKEIRAKLNISPEVKIVLYAPTWRDFHAMDWISLDYEKVCLAFEKKFGGKWCVGIRMHQEAFQYRAKLVKDNANILDFSEYVDMQELMLISDALITDYSSCILDYALLRKPAYCYVPDYQKYSSGHGLLYPLSYTPFPIARTNEEMVEAIVNFDENVYAIKLEDFLHRVGCVENGHATERVIELIQKLAPIDKAI